MPFRWVLSACAEQVPEGLRLKLVGWCLANADIKLLRVKVDGVSRAAPVWYPRADVHVALNGDGRYATWNSLCCGVESELRFDGVYSVGHNA